MYFYPARIRNTVAIASVSMLELHENIGQSLTTASQDSRRVLWLGVYLLGTSHLVPIPWWKLYWKSPLKGFADESRWCLCCSSRSGTLNYYHFQIILIRNCCISICCSLSRCMSSGTCQSTSRSMTGSVQLSLNLHIG